jgi:hypothetical protein
VEKAEVPNHHTLYTAGALQYELAEGSDMLEVRLEPGEPAAEPRSTASGAGVTSST